MKVLILGSTGMAGHIIAIYFVEKGHDVTTFSRSPFPYCKNIIGNALDAESITKILKTHNYDLIVNCIGILNQFAEANPTRAIYLNSYFPYLIAHTIKDTTTRLIHMSTDCVFRGNTGPYSEKSFPDGETIYDRSKALGEIVNNTNVLTFRNSIVGPDINNDGIGLFNWFMKQKGQIKGYSGAIWTGVTTLTLAKAMEQAALQELSGLYHLVNNQTISKYEMLGFFNELFKSESLEIENYSDFKLDKTLTNSRSDFNFIIPGYYDMFSEMKEWIENHKSLYPHYHIIE
jgi:dTDP-4-dehydrorhamnose reductase